jgi:hypothetical protein
MTRALSLALLLLLTGCMTVDYVGTTYPSTTQVDLFFDEADITADYTVMGELRVEGDNHLFMRSEKMQRKLMEQARQRGADGILFAPVAIRMTGETEQTSGTSSVDEKGREWSSSSTTATAQEVKELRGLLLKYRPAA